MGFIILGVMYVLRGTLRFMGLGYVDHTVLVGIRWGERELASCPCMWRPRSD